MTTIEIRNKAKRWFVRKVEWATGSLKFKPGTIEHIIYNASIDSYEAGYRAGRRSRLNEKNN